ncbi:uncharacterized protein LOC128882882 isoform X2 [Hylaeus volcanicus]|uniref:uncharacterized protein LOC128882882 isoform X2 n=1 Tax=Hylaeus volcanicus TaxID=313075 RepID=UPI0023B7A9CE|nr:uncharacterized protein LOC128882882 isoform X2 [Hylaeus volcanicus]
MKTPQQNKKLKTEKLEYSFQNKYLDDVVDEDLLSLCREYSDEKTNSPEKQNSTQNFSTSINTQATITTSNTTICCKHCHSQSNIETVLIPCHLYICRTCLSKRRDTDHYRCISQGRAMRKFALTLEELRTGTVYCKDKLFKIPLIVKQNRNPQGFGAPMKLYYEFQLLELAIAKHGSLNELSRVIENRESCCFQRTVQKKIAKKSKRCDTKSRHTSEALPKFRPNISDNLKKLKTSQLTEIVDEETPTDGLLQEWEEI